TYGYRSGTSMAAAFVSGEAALILSKFGSITAGEIKQKIVDSSDRLSTLVGKVYRGNKINAENAVKGLSSDTIISIGDSGSQDVASAVYGQDIDGGFSTFYTTPQTVTGNVFSIPAEGVNGQLNLKLMGNTETNIVANGNFANGTTGWTPAYGVLSTANNILSVTANGTNYYVRSDETTSSPIIAGHKYYAQAKMRITNSSCLRIGISIDGSTGGIDAYTYQESPAPNQWYLISTIYTTTDHTGNVLIRLRETYPDAATANGKVMEVKEVMAIDLTSRFGAGNEPDAATCASRYANWFDGTKSTLGGRVLSHGKNYVKNGNCEESTKYWTTGGNVTSFTIESGRFKLVTSGTGYAYQLIKVEANTDYYLSGNTDTGIRVYTNDIATLLRSGAGTFNTGTNTEVAVLIRNSGAAVGHADSIMLIKDTSAPSAYEPYTSTEIFFPTIGNSLPNGTKDELDVSTGVKTQRVSGWTIIEGAAITGISTQTNVDIIYAPLSNMSTSIVNNVIDGGIYVPGWTETNVSGIDNVNNIGKYYAYTGYIYFVITKGQSLAYWQNPSNFSVSLTYQLSTPITTSLDIPPLTCYAGGTVYIDNAVRDTAVYGNGIAVSDSGLPIKSLESVYKMAGGTMPPVNLSNVTVASNGFTFAITGAQNGDQYQYTYLYDSSLSTLPTVEFVVPTSQADQINDNTNMTEQQAEIINNLLARVEKLEEQAASGAATQMNAGPFKINCTVNNNISLVLTASNSKDFSSRKFTVIYNASELDVVDLSAETSTLETGICNVSGTNIVITRVDPGVIEFFIYNPVDDGSSFSGAVNTIIFRPKITGQVTISYTVQ
ncbi:MAG: hypothetical protein FIA99_19175, partial [Ruminiclostridium sp.]|nr:hypothetical protein [Ruminiclostridium sp.]